MQRPKGNDVRRATFDGPAALAPFFRDGRLETIPSSAARRLAILEHVVARFERDRDYTEDEVNGILLGVHDDHASLRRYLVDAKLLRRDHGVYRRV